MSATQSILSRMHRPEDDTYKCPDCDDIILRKDFSSHPEVCVYTQRVINQKPVEFDNKISKNIDTNGLPYEAKSSKNEHVSGHVQGQSKYSGPYHCTSCDKAFTTVNGRWIHIKTIHEGIRYKCELCDHRTTQLPSLKIHEQTKHNLHTARNYPCKSCDKIFRSIIGQWQHKRSVHGEFRYKCGQCDHKTMTLGSLKMHKMLEHEGVSFNCDKCAYKAAKKDNLRRHKILKHKVNAPSKYN